MTTKHTNLTPKPITRRGTVHNFENTQGTYNADTAAGSIRIYGECTNRVNGPQTFDRVFKIGDQAEYDSFNLKYVGTIVAIGPRTVTVKHYPNSPEVTRLGLFEFVDRNWDFDSAKTEKYNAEEFRCL